MILKYLSDIKRKLSWPCFPSKTTNDEFIPAFIAAS